MRKLILIGLLFVCVSAFGQFTKPQLYNGINTNIRNKSASQLRLAAILDSIVVSLPTGGSGTVTSLSVATANGFSGTVSNPTTTPAITLTLQNATTGQSGQLTSTDWNTFNNKVSSTRTISTTSPITGGGDLSANRTIAINQATTSTDGYLSSTDWNTFNSKLSSEVDGSVSNELQTITNSSDGTSHTVTLSNSGGTVQFIEGANITLTTGGTGSAGTVTIASTGGGGTYYAPTTLVSNATDANFTATVNGIHNILDGVATANRVITIPTGANGDVLKFYNTEDFYTWSFTGATVYLADRVTVVTQLLYNVPCFIEKIDGLWIITN